MARAAICLDIIPMLAMFVGACISTTLVYVDWPSSDWGDDDEDSLDYEWVDGFFWTLASAIAGISLLLFIVTVSHVFMSAWAVKSLRSIG